MRKHTVKWKEPIRQKRVSPERYCFWGQFSPIEMGLSCYQNLGLNWPLHWGQIRPCKGPIWKTLEPLWIFQEPKQPPQILALLQTTPQKVADSASYRAIMFFLIWVRAYRFLPLIRYWQIMKPNYGLFQTFIQLWISVLWSVHHLTRIPTYLCNIIFV